MIRFNKGEDNMKEQELPLATDMLKTQKFIIKLLGILNIITLLLWFATGGLFIWYLNQYDFITEDETHLVQDIDDVDNTGNISQDGTID